MSPKVRTSPNMPFPNRHEYWNCSRVGSSRSGILNSKATPWKYLKRSSLTSKLPEWSTKMMDTVLLCPIIIHRKLNNDNSNPIDLGLDLVARRPKYTYSILLAGRGLTLTACWIKSAAMSSPKSSPDSLVNLLIKEQAPKPARITRNMADHTHTL